MSYLVAAVLIVAIMAATFAFTVRTLHPTPARIAVVITAIIGFIVVLPPVIEALRDQNPSGTGPAAPANPGNGSGAQR
ncbi:hypothetical protein ACIOWI_35215 [Streptomyces sp. NPDC087659]|uniref:hypothetical protein n=1 Tax=Streptomyces sp. NPDC087659 TaxID=3365801 RepID=UPI0037F71F00